MDFYLIRYINNKVEKLCIWYSNDKDGLCVDEDKKIISFPDIDAAILYVSKKDLSLSNEDDIYTYDFDNLRQWINGNDSTVDCNEILNFWNIFTDVAYSIGITFKGDTKNKAIRTIYDKLFYGCNLPAFKPDGEEDFIPIWNEKQINILKSVLENGLNMFVENIAHFPVI